MELGQLNPHLKALIDAVPTLSDTDKFNLAQKCKNIVVRCGQNPEEVATKTEETETKTGESA